MKNTSRLILVSIVLAVLTGCGLGATIPVNVVFKQGTVTRGMARGTVPASDITAAYAAFGNKLGSYTPSECKVMIQYLFLNNDTDFIDLSPPWPAQQPTAEELAAHYADFTSPVTVTPSSDVKPGEYDRLTFFILDGGIMNVSGSDPGNPYQVQTTPTITVDGTTISSIGDIKPSTHNNVIPGDTMSGMAVFYGPNSTTYGMVDSDTKLSTYTQNASVPEMSTVAGMVTIPMAQPIDIDDKATSVTIEIVWDLTDIISKYDNNTPGDASDDFYVLSDGYWNKLGINVVAE